MIIENITNIINLIKLNNNNVIKFTNHLIDLYQYIIKINNFYNINLLVEMDVLSYNNANYRYKINIIDENLVHKLNFYISNNYIAIENYSEFNFNDKIDDVFLWIKLKIKHYFLIFQLNIDERISLYKNILKYNIPIVTQDRTTKDNNFANDETIKLANKFIDKLNHEKYFIYNINNDPEEGILISINEYKLLTNNIENKDNLKYIQYVNKLNYNIKVEIYNQVEDIDDEFKYYLYYNYYKDNVINYKTILQFDLIDNENKLLNIIDNLQIVDEFSYIMNGELKTITI